MNAPDCIQAALENYRWTPAKDGKSGASVYLLEQADRPAIYLKRGLDSSGCVDRDAGAPADIFDKVATHGDFSLGNIFLESGRVTGCIDVGRSGAADPYQDLAILWNNLEEFGDDLQSELFAAYGILTPDKRKIKFHLCLDEFF